MARIEVTTIPAKIELVERAIEEKKAEAEEKTVKKVTKKKAVKKEE